MRNKNIRKSPKGRITRITVAGFLTLTSLVLCITSICTHAYTIQTLRQQESELNNKLNELKKEADNLGDEITKLKDPDYIAKYARENYYYTKDGEYVIKVNKNDDNNNIAIQADTNKAYYVVSLALLLLIFLFGILNHKSKKKIMEV